jgi:microcystin-dependent protein
MPLQLTNNATSLLSLAIDSSIPTIRITSGDEANFPIASVASGNWFPVTVIDNAGNREIMKCTARTGVNLTVTRGQEGTVKRAFPLNARVEVRLTAGALIEQTSDASALTKGTLDDARLPPRLQPTEMSLTATGNANAVTESGRYWAPGGCANVPIAAMAGYLWADVVSTAVQHQEWQQYNVPEVRYHRQKVATVWGAWEQIFMDKGDSVPIGTVFDFAGAALPTGWMWCDGRQLAKVGTYAALFAAIGLAYVYAGDQTLAANFRVPDLRGRVSAGKDNMGGVSADRLKGTDPKSVNGDVLGETGGEELHKLVPNELPKHKHALDGSTGAPTASHLHSVTYAQSSAPAGGVDALLYKDVASGYGQSTVFFNGTETSHTHPLTGDTGEQLPVTTELSHNNVQPTLILNKIIKFA